MACMFSHTPKGGQFVSWSGHIPVLQARFSEGEHAIDVLLSYRHWHHSASHIAKPPAFICGDLGQLLNPVHSDFLLLTQAGTSNSY